MKQNKKQSKRGTKEFEGGEVGMTVEEWAKDFKSYVNELQIPRDDYKGIMEYIDDALDLLKEQEAKPPIHIHEEYPEHDWKRNEDGDIDEFAYDGDYHNGPSCKRCYYCFCIHCNPNGWKKKPCIIDEYKCPKCGRYISKGTKFCSDCGQAVKWE